MATDKTNGGRMRPVTGTSPADTKVGVRPDDKIELQKIAKERGWTLVEAAHRAVRALRKQVGRRSSV